MTRSQQTPKSLFAAQERSHPARALQQLLFLLWAGNALFLRTHAHGQQFSDGPSAGRNGDPEHRAAQARDVPDKQGSPETSGCLHPAGIPEQLGKGSEPHVQ